MDISQPVLGGVLTFLAVTALGLKMLRSAPAWAVLGLLLSAGLALVASSLLPNMSDPLSLSGHVAALLGLFWALFVWILRRRHGEQGRLRADHPGIVVGQFLCLASCLFAVLVNVYFMVGQFGIAVVHTWNYTLLKPQRWVLIEMGPPVDFLLIVASCLIVTWATRSAYLLVPLFWSLFLAMVRQALLIPPVAPSSVTLSSGLTGVPSLWVLALCLGSALMLAVLVAVQGMSWKNSRRVAWQNDVAHLLRPPRTWPGLPQSVALVGFFVLVMGCLLLVFPAPAGSFISVLPSMVCALATLIAGIAVLSVANRHWRSSLGELGLGLVTLSLCATVLTVLPRQPQALADRFPLIFNALVLGCGLCCFFWMWLAGVWEQQLTPHGVAWTTTGRLVPVAKRTSFLAGAFGVLFALQMGIWPVMDQVEGFDNSAGRILAGYGGMGLLILAVAWAYAKTRRPAFRTLITLNGVALVLYGLVRVLPYTPYGY